MLFLTKRGTKYSRKPRNAQMPFPDLVISQKISSYGGTDFPKAPENAQSGRTAEVRAAQLNNQLNNQLYKNSASLFLTETEMR